MPFPLTDDEPNKSAAALVRIPAIRFLSALPLVGLTSTAVKREAAPCRWEREQQIKSHFQLMAVWIVAIVAYF
jgi:hypothetical protein